jgi:hypothetical protein
MSTASHPKLYQPYGVGARRPVREGKNTQSHCYVNSHESASHRCASIHRRTAKKFGDPDSGWLITRRNIMLLGNCGVGLVVSFDALLLPMSYRLLWRTARHESVIRLLYDQGVQ